MSVVAKNVATYYPAPTINSNAIGVRLVDLRQVQPVFKDHSIEYLTYEGTEPDLIAAGLAPATMFAAVGISGRKSARFTHPDGREEHAILSRRSGDLWRVRRSCPLM